MEFQHTPVMLKETLQYLDPMPGGIYADGTLGGGGHSLEILKHIVPGGRLIGIDRDPAAISAARERLKDWSEIFTAVHGNYAEIQTILKELNIECLDGVIMDLGVSSHQLDEKERGFTYNEDVRLDMRMDTTQQFCAYDVVNGYTAEDLARVFWQYGEERWSKRIAEFVVKNRPIETTGRLVEVIKAAVPASARRRGPHPARRVFQAIRIEVNRELELINEAIDRAVSVLKPGGRLCIITFHSLEDRIVKKEFQRLSNPCTCPPKSPVCLCGKTPRVDILTKKPVLPTAEEIKSNPRSRSAKLRVCQKI